MKKSLSVFVCAVMILSMSAGCFAMDLIRNGSRGDDLR